jgi:hypothetical protein
MSRIRLQPNNDPENAGTEVIAGWDPGLLTYFGQVFGNDTDGMDTPLVDVGNTIAEYTDPNDVIDVLRPYAEIPDDLIDTMTTHRANNDGVTFDDRTQPAERLGDVSYDGSDPWGAEIEADADVLNRHIAAGDLTDDDLAESADLQSHLTY